MESLHYRPAGTPITVKGGICGQSEGLNTDRLEAVTCPSCLREEIEALREELTKEVEYREQVQRQVRVLQGQALATIRHLEDAADSLAKLRKL